MSYINYQLIVEYAKNNDQREYYLQRRLIEPFIESIVPQLYIEDISVIRHNDRTKHHNRTAYCGFDNDGKNIPPDLLLVKEWNYYNVENKLDYRGVVEVKVPFSKQDYYSENTAKNKDDRLYPYEFSEYKESTKDRISYYLRTTENDRVILTDGLQWDFFEKSNIDLKENEIKPVKSFKLVNIINENKIDSGLFSNDEKVKKIKTMWEWSEEDKVYNELVKYIFNFLENKNFKKLIN